MTTVNPSYQPPGQQTLETLLLALKYDVLKNLNCVKVGIIQYFNSELQEATIKIAYQQVTSVAPDGSQTIAEYPLLLNVPVQFPGGGGFTHTFPISQGDECVVLFNDRQLDAWLLTGQSQPPSSQRVHDLSDGIAIVGLRNNTRPLANFSTTASQFRSDDGETYVEVAGGGIVNIVAPTQINLVSPIVQITGIIAVQNINGDSTPCTVNGNIVTDGDVIASGVSLVSHIHGGVQTGSGDTGPPI